MADNDLKREYEPDDAPEVRATLETLLQKARLQRQISPTGPSVAEAADWDTEKDLYQERRKYLREQAKRLIERGL